MIKKNPTPLNYDIQQQITNTEKQAPDLEHAHTECGVVECNRKQRVLIYLPTAY